MVVEEKLQRLEATLEKMGSLLVAFSGGVDSTFLLKVAYDCLGDNVIAVTANSDTYSSQELVEAKGFAEALGVRHMIIDSEELHIQGFRENTPQRCYYCKQELFSRLKGIARRENVAWVADGTNSDDTGDYRPGMKAAAELGVRSPLKEAGLTKEEIRRLSKKMGLPTWDKPPLACLASRFPYGTEITREELRRVGEAEKLLRNRGIRTVRVRHHGHIARIEVGVKEMARFFEPDFRTEVIEELKRLGYLYVALDLEGYRSGSMNEVLNPEEKLQPQRHRDTENWYGGDG
ncbi:MAG: ATP-dependent sacrificial sulfur transferase LarE [bacterium]